jgi:hypothetical protein
VARKFKWPTDSERWLQHQREKGSEWESEKIAAKRQRNLEHAARKFERDMKKVDEEMEARTEAYRQEQEGKLLLAMEDEFGAPSNINHAEEYKRLREEDRAWTEVKETSRPPRSVMWGRKKAILLEPLRQGEGLWNRFVQVVAKVFGKPVSTECEAAPSAADKRAPRSGASYTEVREPKQPFVLEHRKKPSRTAE